ncbi:MAG: hypothetical protein EZS28_025590 [Streblomastix strix]|uniref:KilA-N domain-containing protein n=1 Tax=Streblomastix strix TaxID=222440 RepID=A0A5J4V8T6_9EUKA|nr:MAG: hypothetical protein EZS28_025590 [Streblomastix strix]
MRIRGVQTKKCYTKPILYKMEQVKTTTKISNNNIRFVEGSYCGLKLLIKSDDNYVNASKFCESYNKRFRKLIGTEHWKDYIKAETTEFESAPKRADLLMYQINKGFDNEYKGYYIHPILINYVAIWINPKYAVYVRKIMDLFDERIHLEHQLDDSTSMAEQASITFDRDMEEMKAKNNELKEQIQQKETENKQLETRAVPDGYQTDYIFAVQVEDDDENDNAVLNIRRRNKYCTSKKLMGELKDSLLFYEKIPIKDQQKNQLNFNLLNEPKNSNESRFDLIAASKPMMSYKQRNTQSASAYGIILVAL